MSILYINYNFTKKINIYNILKYINMKIYFENKKISGQNAGEINIFNEKLFF